MALPVLYHFDRWDEPLGILHPVGAITHVEVLCGEDTLDFESLDTPDKGDRIVWQDPESDIWHEHEVVRVIEPEQGPTKVHAEASFCELLRDFVVEAQLVTRTTAQALETVLANSRWTVGTIDDSRTYHHGSTLIYHTNALAALRRIEEVWDGEIEFSITLDNLRVATRTVNFYPSLGSWRGARLTYGRNMLGCTRTVLDDEIYTAMYGYGKGLPVEDEETGELTGGYTRRLSFADVNDGVAWVGSDTARELYGRWDEQRQERVHSFGCVVFADCDDPYKLRKRTYAAVREHCMPKVSYTCDIALLKADVPIRIGDEVAIIDTAREPAWHHKQRVRRIERTFTEASPIVAKATIGVFQPAPWTWTSNLAVRVDTVEQVAAKAVETATKTSETIAGYEDLSEKDY